MVLKITFLLANTAKKKKKTNARKGVNKSHVIEDNSEIGTKTKHKAHNNNITMVFVFKIFQLSPFLATIIPKINTCPHPVKLCLTKDHIPLLPVRL